MNKEDELFNLYERAREPESSNKDYVEYWAKNGFDVDRPFKVIKEDGSWKLLLLIHGGHNIYCIVEEFNDGRIHTRMYKNRWLLLHDAAISVLEKELPRCPKSLIEFAVRLYKMQIIQRNK